MGHIINTKQWIDTLKISSSVVSGSAAIWLLKFLVADENKDCSCS